MEKEVLEYLGFDPEKVKTIDDFKANFQAGYLNKSALENQKSPEYRELLPKFVGKVAGAVDTRIRSTLKKIGVELTDDELQDRSNIEDIAEYAISKVHQTTQGKLKELQEQAGQGVDERFKQLEQMNIKLKEKADQQAEMIKSLGTEKETLLKNFEGEKKSWTVNLKKSDLFKGIKFNEEAKKNELMQKGFFAEVENTLNFDLDEKGEFSAFDKKSGSLIPRKNKQGFMSPDEAIEDLGLKLGVWEQNPHGGQVQQKKTFVQNNLNQPLQNQNGQGIFNPPANNRQRKVSGRIQS